MAEKVIITISPTGGVHIEGHGFHGKSCEGSVDEFEKAIGKTKEKGKKPDYFAPNPRREKTTTKVSR